MDKNYQGIIEDPRSPELKAKDQILGVDSPIILTYPYDKKYLPVGELQHLKGKFDTQSCATFSTINILQTILEDMYYTRMKPENKKFLEDEGYIVNGKVRLSTRFSAIVNGTTKQGNYFHKVWDYHRNIGVLPYLDLPFGGQSFEEYHNPQLITQAMRDKAMRFRQRFEIRYAWLPTDSQSSINTPESDNILHYQKYAPLQIGMPIPAYHAQVQVEMKDNQLEILDTYNPLYKTVNKDNYPVNFYLFGYVTEREELLTETPVLKRVLKLGMYGADVKLLQSQLRKLGYFTFPTDTGFFGTITLMAVKQFQKEHGIIQTGNYGDRTHAKLYKLLNK